MTTKIIPIVDQRAANHVPVIPAHTPASVGTLVDTRGRLLRDLRISVTDRCNFRCTYCMPKSVFDKDYQYLPKPELLSFEVFTQQRLAAGEANFIDSVCDEQTCHTRDFLETQQFGFWQILVILVEY